MGTLVDLWCMALDHVSNIITMVFDCELYHNEYAIKHIIDIHIISLPLKVGIQYIIIKIT